MGIISSERAVTLSLSYVTDAAFWTPRYDLNISSQQKSATIVYRAEFSNGTSETWKDTKVILSTSQTSYSGLDDKAPFMQSWQVKLGKSWDNNAGGLLSSSEQKGYRYQQAIAQQASKASYKMKSNANTNNTTTHWENMPAQQQTYNTTLFSTVESHPAPGGALFGSSRAAAPPPPPQSRARPMAASAAPL